MQTEMIKCFGGPDPGNPVLVALAAYFKDDSGRLSLSDAVISAMSLLKTIPGEIRMYGGSTPPTGFLICDGSIISRSTYSDLFAVIGTAFGPGDGSTTFSIPDLREAAPAGIGIRSSGVTAHDAFTLGQFKDDQIQNHEHALGTSSNDNGSEFSREIVIAGTTYTTSAPLTNTTLGNAHAARAGDVTRGKRIGLNFIIKY